MKTVKKLFNKLFIHKNIDDNNKDHQAMSAAYVDENGGATVIKNESWLKKKQDSIKEIFLMCMTPYI